jgi:hypothetical protein
VIYKNFKIAELTNERKIKASSSENGVPVLMKIGSTGGNQT